MNHTNYDDDDEDDDDDDESELVCFHLPMRMRAISQFLQQKSPSKSATVLNGVSAYWDPTYLDKEYPFFKTQEISFLFRIL